MQILIYTPGPTDVPDRVLRRMATPITNPDFDHRFIEFYSSLQGKIQKLMKTENDVLIMSGEALLGLESALASLVGKDERVLTITNGEYGESMGDFVKLYGGIPVRVEGENNQRLEAEIVEEALDNNEDIRVATFVHCETPSGVINPLEKIAKACQKHGTILIADTVSSLGGVPVDVDKWGIDICVGASQKCLSAPPGLTLISISEKAWELIGSRRDKIHGYYLNLWQWNEWWKKNKLFPYTASISDIYALDEALDMYMEEGLERAIERHRIISNAAIAGCRAIGLTPYPKTDLDHSPTVTAIIKPPRIDEHKLRMLMEDRYSVMIAGSWGKLAGNVLRLGNMGYNAQQQKILTVLWALESALKDLGFKPNSSGVEKAKALFAQANSSNT
ncbi:MAG TPA: alanine--glyoxylate aminotransferase family protein [Candidatus Bathyarchaeia archaeon]|nr:alanine--glyoxylate aminotransferase family protein [Candidatus Bathyarchaeia archaeon]